MENEIILTQLRKNRTISIRAINNDDEWIPVKTEDKLNDIFYIPPSLPTKIIKKVVINSIVNKIIKKIYAEILKGNTNPKESINVYTKLLM